MIRAVRHRFLGALPLAAALAVIGDPYALGAADPVPIQVCIASPQALTIDGVAEDAWNATAWSRPFLPFEVHAAEAEAPEKPDEVRFKALFDEQRLYLLLRSRHPLDSPPREPLEQSPFGTLPGFLPTNTQLWPAATYTLYIDPRGPESDRYGPGEPGHFALRFTLLFPILPPGNDPIAKVVVATTARYYSTGDDDFANRVGWSPPDLSVAFVDRPGAGFQLEMALPFAQMHPRAGDFVGQPRRGERSLDVVGTPASETVWGLQIVREDSRGGREGWVLHDTNSPRPPSVQRPLGQLWFRHPHPALTQELWATRANETSFEPATAVAAVAAVASAPTTPQSSLFATSWSEASERASRRRAPLFIFYATPALFESNDSTRYWSDRRLRAALRPFVLLWLDLEHLPAGARDLGMRRQPAIGILDPRGRVLERWTEPPSPSQLAERLEQLVAPTAAAPR